MLIHTLLILASTAHTTHTALQPADPVVYEITNEGRRAASALHLETPWISGRFDVTLTPIDQGNRVEVRLTGVITGRAGLNAPIDADLTFVYAIDQNPVQQAGNARLVRGDGASRLFIRDRLAPGAHAWSDPKNPALGSVTVWDAPDPDQHLTDSVVLSLYHDLVDQGEGVLIQGTESDPSFTECVNAAKSTCHPNRVGTLTYACDEGSVTCGFTCLQQPPGEE